MGGTRHKEFDLGDSGSRWLSVTLPLSKVMSRSDSLGDDLRDGLRDGLRDNISDGSFLTKIPSERGSKSDVLLECKRA